MEGAGRQRADGGGRELVAREGVGIGRGRGAEGGAARVGRVGAVAPVAGLDALHADDTGAASFNALQQRLGRKLVSKAMLADYPAFVRLYDILFDGAEDLRERPWHERRARFAALQRCVALIEPQLGLALQLVGPVAIQTQIGQDRPNVAIEIDSIATFARCEAA